MCVMPRSRSVEMTVPSVSIRGVNEWPAPAARTPAPLAIARRTSSATSPSLAGSATAAGANDWFPTQFVQVGTSQ